MTSQIDPTKPTEDKAYTADVRANFLFAHDEISALQDSLISFENQAGDIATLQAQVATLQTTVASLQSQIDSLRMFAGVGTWGWQAAPQSGSISNNHVGLDTDAPASATTLWVTTKSDDGSDWAAAFAKLKAGDGLLLWDRKNSANSMQFNVTAPSANFTTYCTVPIALATLEGVEPINNADVNIQFIFAAQGGSP